jgi:hypothetical protein
MLPCLYLLTYISYLKCTHGSSAFTIMVKGTISGPTSSTSVTPAIQVHVFQAVITDFKITQYCNRMTSYGLTLVSSFNKLTLLSDRLPSCVKRLRENKMREYGMESCDKLCIPNFSRVSNVSKI